MTELLKLVNISKSFGGTHALKSVNLTLEAGKLHAIVGENGAGKSTLIKTIMGVHQPDTGQIIVEGKQEVIGNPSIAKNLGFSAVFQDPLIYPHLSVLENIFLNGPILNRFGNLDFRQMENKITPFCEELGFDTKLLRKPMSSLRLGHRQLAMILKALVEDARLIIFDEPTAILSAGEIENLFNIISYLKRSNKAVVYISHRLEELMRIADEATILTDGKVVGYQKKEELNVDTLISMMSGKEEREYQHDVKLYQPDVKNTPVVEINNMCKEGTYENISLKIWPGEVLGIYGQVGAGRSEVALSLFGSNPADSGEIYVDGKKANIQKPWDAIRQGIGYLPEDRKSQGVFSFQSIENNLISVIFKKLKGPLSSLSRKKSSDLITKYQKILNIKYGDPSNPISSLSGGNQQKVIFGRWMAEDLKLLILDEPTQGIDIITKRQIHELIHSLAKKEGLAVLVITSDLPELLSVSSRILVMNRGQIVAEYDEAQENLAEKLLRNAVGIGGK
ncbi:sugar ABC transporter ATP-binding protein [Neobacillus pocheonensis]|uniref:sugar ABC transporter ATP-binding protein n=1 Tax=Neobacillus pocheonensis TaxID=363869 RepID=UPI003D2B819F